MLVMIGHRGSHGPNGGAVENTLAAFEAAIREGADLIELDVWRTTDDGLVVYHDARVPGSQVAVSSLTMADVRRVALAEGQRIPTLDEVLDLCRNRVGLNVELKHRAALPGALERIRARGMQTQVILSSFDLETMVEAAWLAPGLARAVIMERTCSSPAARLREVYPFWALRRADAAFWHAEARLVAPSLVDALHRLEVRVNVWTVNDPVVADFLQKMGVDGIFTDHPGSMRRALTR